MIPIVQIPYKAIGTLLAIVFIVLAVYYAETKGRIIILSLTGMTFLLPILFSSFTLNFICWLVRILIGIGCYIYLKIKK